MPTFDQKVLDDLKAKFGNDDRIDGWAAIMQQLAPVIDTTSKQSSGQTLLEGVGPDSKTPRAISHHLRRYLRYRFLKDGDILADKSAADKLNATVGDDSECRRSWQALLQTPRDSRPSSPSTQFPVAFVTLSQLQTMFNAPGQVTRSTSPSKAITWAACSTAKK